jgi:hypothetical protein
MQPPRNTVPTAQLMKFSSHFNRLTDWTTNSIEGIKHYSGKATYRKEFTFDRIPTSQHPLYLDLDVFHQLAAVRLNGKDLGVLWCAPWRVNITDAVTAGRNELEIDAFNTWQNRLVNDLALPAEKRVTTIPKRFPPNSKSPLEPLGLLGPITIQKAQ